MSRVRITVEYGPYEVAVEEEFMATIGNLLTDTVEAMGRAHRRAVAAITAEA